MWCTIWLSYLQMRRQFVFRRWISSLSLLAPVIPSLINSCEVFMLGWHTWTMPLSLESNLTKTEEKAGWTALLSCLITYVQILISVWYWKKSWMGTFIGLGILFGVTNSANPLPARAIARIKCLKNWKVILYFNKPTIISYLEGVGPIPKVNSLALFELRRISSSK
jgi:hypothetical protein